MADDGAGADICPRCRRPYRRATGPAATGVASHGPFVKTYVEHQFYGCDTGCCGHVAVAEDAAGNRCEGDFDFFHRSGAEPLEWARELALSEFPYVPFSPEDCEISDD